MHFCHQFDQFSSKSQSNFLFLDEILRILMWLHRTPSFWASFRTFNFSYLRYHLHYQEKVCSFFSRFVANYLALCILVLTYPNRKYCKQAKYFCNQSICLIKWPFYQQLIFLRSLLVLSVPLYLKYMI